MISPRPHPHRHEIIILITSATRRHLLGMTDAVVYNVYLIRAHIQLYSVTWLCKAVISELRLLWYYQGTSSGQYLTHGMWNGVRVVCPLLIT